MKFHNGCWLFKEGYECFSPQHVYEVRKSEQEVVLCAPTGGSTIREILWRNQPDGQDHGADAGGDPCTDIPSYGSC